jgi:hypothetical protein
MKRTLLLLCAAILFASSPAIAQQLIEHKPARYIDQNNRIYQQVKLPVYVFISNTPNAADAVGMSQTHHADQKNEVQPCYLDGEGVHTIRHQDEIEHEVVKFFVYADGSAPVSKSVFKGAPAYKNATTQFYGKGLVVSLSTKDNMSGVAKFYQSVNGVAYTEYKDSLSFAEEKEYSLKYYAADNVGNMEKVVEKKYTVDITAPTTKHRIEGLAINGVISKYTKVYLDKEDKLSGVAKTYYQIDGGKEVRYYKGALPTASLSNGDHTITYYSEDNVGNKENVQTFKFYLDKEAPIVDTRIVGDQHSKGAATYVSGRTKIELSATDNKSGVKSIKYSINSKPFEVYTTPIPVPQDRGLQTFRYSSEDEMTNKGIGDVNVKSLRVYVDLTPPAVSHKYVGPQFQSRDTVFIRSNTDIKLYATDRESGVQRIGYKLDAGAEQTYGDKVNVMNEGMHEIEYTGYDNVNNAQTKKINFIVDNNPPIIYEHFSITPLREENGVQIFAKHTIVFLAATDGITGNKTIYYRINNGPKRVYAGNISGFRPDTEYTISVEAIDQIGNIGEKVFKFKTDKN